MKIKGIGSLFQAIKAFIFPWKPHVLTEVGTHGTVQFGK